MTTTLLQLRNKCKQRADMSGSLEPDQFIPDEEWNGYINASIGEYHDTVVRNDVRFYLTSSVFTPAAGVNTVALPTDFAVADGLEKSWDGSGSPGTWFNVPKYQWRDRNFGSSAYFTLYMPPQVAYNIVGGNVMLMPPLNATGTYQLWYYPVAPELVADTDIFTDPGNNRYWYEYVIVDAAIKALQKEESDVSVLMAQKQALKGHIELMGSDRDFSTPEQAGRKGNGGGFDGGFGGGLGGGGW